MASRRLCSILNQLKRTPLLQKLRREDVVTVTGRCLLREGGENPKLATGKIEVDATACTVLNDTDTPPFMPDEADKVGEETRLRYRYVDLRRPAMQHILKTRHRVTKIMRDYLDEHGFYEVETPFLCRSTPEGARDFLVPSRLQAGEFYALPQSPQLFKQILMVGGLERYFQIARCFRDEDPRADRQAEFTQLDMEMSFVEQDDVMAVNEGMMRRIWKEVLGVDIPDPVRRMPFEEAMRVYGSDRPDLRFGMELHDLTDVCRETDFKVFTGAIAAGGIVNAIRVPGGASADAEADRCVGGVGEAVRGRGAADREGGGREAFDGGGEVPRADRGANHCADGGAGRGPDLLRGER